MTGRAGKWGLRILAFVGAVVVWWIASVETRERVSEKVVDASLSYNSTRGLILLDPAQTVKVRLRGPDRRIRAIAPFSLDVVVDVQTDEPGSVPIQLRAEDVLAPEEVEIVSIDPNILEVRLDREAVIEVPILVRLIGEPAGGTIPGEPVAKPARARIRGPATIVSGITSVSTSPISLDGHALDFSQTVSVVPSDPLVRIVEPTFVTVQIPMRVPESPVEEPPRGARRGGGE
ncbi:MAG: CdaR family protein [Thermoanaerobaculia bacterium]|nr:CdaR family protein [Thermoanaerobaculia bacterium]